TNYYTTLNSTPYEVVYGQAPPIHIPYMAKDSSVEAIDRTLQAREQVVVAKIGKVAYQLQLPDYVKVHHVFHVSQLKPCYIEVATMRSFPLCDSEDLLAATPLKLLEIKMVKHNNRLVVLRMRLGKSWKT
ncbi:hypothetical protein Tco_0570924, partial [Tanacetum coccineum]